MTYNKPGSYYTFPRQKYNKPPLVSQAGFSTRPGSKFTTGMSRPGGPGTTPGIPVLDFTTEILMYLRFMKKTRSEVSLYEPLGTDREGNEITLMDVLGTDSEAVTDKVAANLEQQRLLRKMGKLSKREKRVLEMRLGLGREGIKTQREIARMLGISRSYVSRIEKRALDKLVKELGLQSCS